MTQSFLQEKSVQRLLGLAIMAASLVFFVHTLKLKLITDRQTEWPTVMATLLEARFEEHTKTVQRGNRRERVGYWVPHYRYTYQVNGASFTSTRVSYEDTSELDGMDVRAINKCQEYMRIKVHYNPDAPQDSVIVPSFSIIRVWLYLIGSLIGMGAGFYVNRLGQTTSRRYATR